MARKHSTRHRARRKLEAVGVACDTINNHLAQVSSWYEKDMSNVSRALLEIGTIIEAARTLTLQLREGL